MKFSKGDTITNGSSAGTVLEVVEQRLSHWKAPGYRIQNIPTELFGGNAGQASELPEYLAHDWRLVPFEWSPIVGGALEERYVWRDGYRRLERELRRAAEGDPGEKGPPETSAKAGGQLD